jgi:hypothetical protein
MNIFGFPFLSRASSPSRKLSSKSTRKKTKFPKDLCKLHLQQTHARMINVSTEKE